MKIRIPLALSILLLFQATASATHLVLSNSPPELTSQSVPTRGVPSVQVHLEVPAIDVNTDRDGWDRVSAELLAPLFEPGAPDLRATGELLAVPEGYSPVLRILDTETREISGISIGPAQHKYRCGSERPAPPEFRSDLYRSDNPYPSTVAAIEEVGRLQSLRIVRLALHPLRFFPASRRLQVTTRLTVRVDFTPTSRSVPVMLAPALWQVAQAFTANAADLTPPFLRARAGRERMLIVTADSLRAELERLAAWKRTKGIDVDLVTFSEAGGTNDQLKAYIQSYYDRQTTKPSYLVLAGNKDTLPPFMESTSSGKAASDWRYALLSGNDNVPDVLYGRVVADNEAEARIQIDRWIAYEKNPDPGTWYPQATTIASDQSGSDTSDVGYVQQTEAILKQHGYQNVDHLYQGEGTATAARISGALSEGRTWLTYIGHGSGSSWGSTNDSFGVSQVDRLTNGGRLPILIDVACENASWVSMRRCFGKAWMTGEQNEKPTGAVGYYGGSVSISWDPPAIMSVGIAKAHFEKPIPNLGGSVLGGQLYLIEKMGSNNDTLDNLKWYNLFGDPSLLVRTAVPKAFTLNTQLRRGRGELGLSAVDAEGKPLPGAQLAASSAADASLLAVATTDADGYAVLDLPAAATSGTRVTATGYNLETHQLVVP